MERRETFKIIDLGGRKWRIEKLSPLAASYIMAKVMGRLAPLAMGIMNKTVTDPGVQVMAIGEALGGMSRADFYELQMDALSVVKEVQVVANTEAYVPVLMQSGTFSVPGLEDDPLTVIALAAHAILFNVLPFFDLSAVKSVGETFKGFSLFTAKE